MLQVCPKCQAKLESVVPGSKCAACGTVVVAPEIAETIVQPGGTTAPAEVATLANPAREDWDEWNDQIELFLQEWAAGRQPSIDSFLSGPATGRLECLVELVCEDLEQRMRIGIETRVESYFARYPELLAQPNLALEVISWEFQLRRRGGEQISEAEVEQRFPEHREALSTVLAAGATSRRRRVPQRVRCPHCEHPMMLAAATCGENVDCPHCHGKFWLDPDRTQSWNGGRLPKLGRYQLRHKLGGGAFGSVYSAHDSELDRLVAVKIPRPGAFEDREAEDAFLNEARAAAQIHHRHIVAVYDCGRLDGVPFIVTELVAGATLADHLVNRGYAPRESADLIATIAEALQHAHALGIYHRDLKPGNLMIDAAGEPRIMDFGLALRRKPGEPMVTLAGQILGTAAYMSPEQARGESELADARSDVYALGVILFEMLTGRRPFRGKTMALLQAVRTIAAPSPRDIDSRVPRDLDTICLKCLRKAPADRYPSAAELAADLRRFLRHEPIMARPVSRWERAGRWCQRNPVVSGSAAAVFLVLVLSLIVVSFFWRGERAAKQVQAQLAVENRGLYEKEQDARRAAQASRDQALRRLADARRAVDRSVDEVSDALQSFPGTEEVKRLMLRNAAEDYARFASEHETIPELKWEQARALLRLGMIHHELGEDATSEEVVRRAIQLLASSTPGTDSTDRLLLANAHTQLGSLLATLRRGEDAAGELRLGRAILDEVASSGVKSDVVQESLSAWRFNAARLAQELGDPTEAARLSADAIAGFRDLAERHPDQPRYRTMRAQAESQEAQLMLELGKATEAAAGFDRAIRTLDKLAREHPDDTDTLSARATTRVQYAAAERALGHPWNALKLEQDAAEDYSLLVEARPGIPGFVDHLALTLINVGLLQHQLERCVDSETTLRRALRLADPLANAYPTDPNFLLRRGKCRQALGNVLADRNQLPDAIQELSKAEQDLDALHVAFPKDVELAEAAALVNVHLARRLQSHGEHATAEGMFQRAIELLSGLCQDHPERGELLNLAAHAHYRFALFLHERAREADSRRELDEAKGLWSELANGPTSLAGPRGDFAQMLLECPVEAFRDPRRAATLATTLSTEAPDNSHFASLKAHALIRSGKWEEGLAELDRAAAQHPEVPIRDLFFRALACAGLMRSDEARSAQQLATQRLLAEQPGNPDLLTLRDEVLRVVKEPVE